MPYTLPALPYAQNALEPHISANTLSFHYGKHHQAYVNNLNKLVPDGSKSLEELIETGVGGVFNNAAQVWNHTFYWNSMAPSAGGEPTGPIKALIDSSFGSFAKFKELFSDAATTHFGSGWAWLVLDAPGHLKIVTTHDAANPLKDHSGKPLLCCDVWEHAYYLDYQNARAAYISAWWSLVNWKFANANL